MKIATYNAASIRARLPRLLEWMEAEEPDVLVIQETKVEDSKFPIEEFEALGYEVAIHGQKAWNGVAILSRLPITNVRKGFEDPLMIDDCRIITCQIGGIHFINTYVPNGNTVGSEKWIYKMAWLDRFDRLLRERYRPDDALIWLGDVNIAPEPKDVFDSPKMLGGVGHHPDEFAKLKKILSFGLTDVFRHFEQGPRHFTFWDFTIPNGLKRNAGWRIDHIYATEPVLLRFSECFIDRSAREREKPSDHTFVVADLL